MLEKVKTAFIAIGVFFSGIAAGIAGFLFLSRSSKAVPLSDMENAAKTKRDEVKHEIENTSADALVDNASNSGELRANAGTIANNAKQRLRDRAGEIVQRENGSGNSSGGGSGD